MKNILHFIFKLLTLPLLMSAWIILAIGMAGLITVSLLAVVAIWVTHSSLSLGFAALSKATEAVAKVVKGNLQ